ncbi:MAG: GNAT family N-acetyltransferase [Spirulinaceae cyanobacterium]
MVEAIAPLHLRTATPDNFAAIWAIFQPIVLAGETYEFDESLTPEQARAVWLNPQTHTVVAELHGQVVGAYKIKPNHAGRGSHVANGSYIVADGYRGRGIGRQLVEHSLQTAREQGYRAMQFNIVVSTNKGAIALYEKLGFAIVATLPGAFRHRTLGHIDTHVMYRCLRD